MINVLISGKKILLIPHEDFFIFNFLNDILFYEISLYKTGPKEREISPIFLN